jgi:predicted ATPase
MRLLDVFAELLGLPADERYPALAVSPQQKREMTLSAFLDQLASLAARSPVLVVFEDAHWIDPTSLDLLNRTVARAANLPVLLVVTVRPELQPTWVGEPHVTMLPLSRLGRRDSANIIAGVTDKTLPDAVVEQVLARTDGAPLFIEELTSTLIDRVMQLMAHRGTGIVLYQLGNFASAQKELEQSLALYDPERDRSLAARYITDPFASASALLALVAWISGFPDRAARMQAQALSYAAALNHVNTSGFVHFIAGAAPEQLFGNMAALLTHTQTLSALATEHGVLAWRSSGIIFEGWAVSWTSGPESGISLMQKGIADVDAKNLTFFVPLFTSLLAQVRGRVGDFQSALALCIDARERAQRSEQYIWEAELHRNEGEVRRAAGHSLTDVEECFGKALDVSRAQGARMFELRATTSLARLWRDQGRHVEARNLLASVYGWFIRHSRPGRCQSAPYSVESIDHLDFQDVGSMGLHSTSGLRVTSLTGSRSSDYQTRTFTHATSYGERGVASASRSAD